jgi:hypothetical protein
MLFAMVRKASKNKQGCKYGGDPPQSHQVTAHTQYFKICHNLSDSVLNIGRILTMLNFIYTYT